MCMQWPLDTKVVLTTSFVRNPAGNQGCRIDTCRFKEISDCITLSRVTRQASNQRCCRLPADGLQRVSGIHVLGGWLAFIF